MALVEMLFDYFWSDTSLLLDEIFPGLSNEISSCRRVVEHMASVVGIVILDPSKLSYTHLLAGKGAPKVNTL